MKRITVPDIVARKGKEKITSLTAYDYITAKILDEGGVDIILVGDSASMVMQGNDSTIPITMDEMIYHTRIVSRAVKRALVVGDMPFGSYQESISEGVRNAVRFMKEGGAHAVKVEGGMEVLDLVERLTSFGIPVMGHIGLMPQRVHQLGGYKLVKDEGLVEVAKALEEAGVFAIVLEKVPVDIARRITESVSVPTIGIGAGPHVDGQVLVFHDIVGLSGMKLKFVRQYVDGYSIFLDAVRRFVEDVREGLFPSEEESYG